MQVTEACERLIERHSALIEELTRRHDILRRQLERACLQRDACMAVIAMLLIVIVLMRWA